MSDLAARRQLNRGYNDGLSRAIEIVVTPVVFGFAGHLVDAWLGTRPGFTIGLATVGVVGTFVKLWLGYDREIREHEAERALSRRPAAMPGYVSVTVAAAKALRPTGGDPAAPSAAGDDADPAPGGGGTS